MEDEKIDIVKNCPEPKFIYDIHVFLSFANFCQCFIQGFNKITRLLASMLRTTSYTGSLTILQSLVDTTNKDEFGRDKRHGNETKILSTSFTSNNKLTGVGYLTSNTKKTFNFLWHIFIQVFILQQFDLKWHIRIKTNILDYTISRVLSQLTLNDSGQ